MNKVYSNILNKSKSNQKQFAVLIDPDNLQLTEIENLVRLSLDNQVDYFFVGGSLVTGLNAFEIISAIKTRCNIPVVLFPGNYSHISENADALLFLSVISGRNPEHLIGQHVLAAPLLKKSGLEIISTGYILVDGGKQTTVSYISNTTPIPADKPVIAACTAMAGEMLGLKLIYLDAGSGALNPVSDKIIATVNKSVEIPIVVGGGIKTVVQAVNAWNSGADIVVVGNSIEENVDLLTEIAKAKLNL